MYFFPFFFNTALGTKCHMPVNKANMILKKYINCIARKKQNARSNIL